MIPCNEFTDLPILGQRFHVFGFLVALGVLAGHQVAVMRARSLGLSPVSLVDRFVLVVFTAGFISAHMLDTIFYHPDVLRRNPLELLMIHHGLSSFGGIAGATVGGLLFLRIKKLNPWVWADLCTYAFPFGWVFGRLGCAMVHDHLGQITQSPIAVKCCAMWVAPTAQFVVAPLSDACTQGPRYDLGLTELALTPILFAVVLGVARRTRRPGMISGAFAIAYAMIRFPLDFLRATDLGPDSDPRYGGLTPAQYACLFSVLFGAWMLHRARSNAPLPLAAGAQG